MTIRTATFFFALGGIANWLAAHMDNGVVRDQFWFWLFMIIPSMAGGFYLIVKLELLKNKSYRKIKGVKRFGYKTLMCMVMVMGSVVMFGGMLNCVVLLPNYLGNGERKTESFKILEIHSVRLWRRSTTRVPVVKFSDGSITDEIKISDIHFDDFNQDIHTVVIESRVGLLGLRIIEDKEFK